MDAPNYALASYLARAGKVVHVVAHRASDELCNLPNIVFHRVPKPANAYSLGGPFLASAGLLRAAMVSEGGGHVMVNGGNCPYPAVNWVHYVLLASVCPDHRSGRGLRSAKAAALHRVGVLTERLALRAARVVVANSHRTRRDVIEHVDVAEDRVRTVFYGVDGSAFRPATDDERVRAREALGWKGEHRRVAFVGALGDRRKGFDVVYDAWRILSTTSSGTCAWWWAARVRSSPHGESWSAMESSAGVSPSSGSGTTCHGFLPRATLSWRPRGTRPGAGARGAVLRFTIASDCDGGCCGRYPGELRPLLLDDPESADDLVSALLRWREKAPEWRDDCA